MSSSPNLGDRTVTITAKDLPLYCPPKNAPLWSQHPRVFLEVEEDGEILCPYCGTHYVLEGGPLKGGH